VPLLDTANDKKHIALINKSKSAKPCDIEEPLTAGNRRSSPFKKRGAYFLFYIRRGNRSLNSRIKAMPFIGYLT